MKTLGLIGGMSWESTATYYRLLNEHAKAALGGLHSARLVLVSVDFAEVEALQACGDWDAAGALLARACRQLEAAGADAVVLCTNTMHKVAPAMQAATDLPFLHIGDATAAAIRAAGLDCVGLLGTRFTMEQDFYRARLEARGIRVLVPEADDRATVHRIIYDELCLGDIRPTSRTAYLDIIGRLAAAGAQGVVLGCTEIPLLVSAGDTSLPLFDTTALHARFAADFALG
ncbi:aspartate/glutamate racemase family protein [Laribacter hongkongensis]|jgi:aspartate racemase|uniref:aspartate/glutamate racemase family protein n=1 Tax=Laribacter hongkongensis TaxID=168471 RepID=UPI001EFDD33C|nr:aspartate/glutamate racemase family protein [Laribacter hongkongensis]MCG8992616.1 aspartate/glutamate racemase family protein [Laribacter hongkongensis]MCG8998869.1 aspartate/glutamate racemase family protein [Laribacter hongkongensis]MCG9001807.1 aspartate/glutamate racemase family protein [Laribacter hongkongensis]MCG9003395.1 aspartate/glutamate racemase family protein [Laribacter hongkongensis]MCG9006892.1 aspartate/glutamate racemase family protein [Laribacter hongkongensis]